MAAAKYLWSHRLARTEQLAPDGDWTHWLYLAGRGAGKTRTAGEWLIDKALKHDGARCAVVAPTFGDARDICVEGESGLLSIVNRYGVLKNWNRSNGELSLTNGSRIKLFSSEEPDRLRGPQHNFVWCDELASFKRQETFDMMTFGLRLGQHPQAVHTTTPRTIKRIKDLLSRADGSVVVTRGSTFDNAANLAPTFFTELMARYEGTRLGRQEMYGEVLEDVEGALWSARLLEQQRVNETPQLVRVVVGVDPAVTANASSDETGIVVAGRAAQGDLYVLADRTLKGTPNEWANQVIAAYDEHDADAVVVEVNNGGDMITTLLRSLRPALNIIEVRATRGKQLRAEPISALYEQGRVWHVWSNEHSMPHLQHLEDQMTSWTPEDAKSPDRLDALVWALTSLSNGASSTSYLTALAVWCGQCNLPMPKNTTHCHKCGMALKESE